MIRESLDTDDLKKKSFLHSAGEVYQTLRQNVFYQIVFFIVVSFLQFFLLELFINPESVGYSFALLLKNVLLIAGVNLFLTGIFHALRPALFLSEAFFFLIGIANYFIIRFRGYGIVFMDFHAIKTAAGVAGGYHYDISAFLMLLLLFSALLFFVTCFGLPKRKHKYPDGRYLLLSLGAMLISVLFFFWINFDPTFFRGVSSLSWDHSIGMRDYGYLLYFLSNAGKETMEEPIGYSAKAVDEELSKYEEPLEAVRGSKEPTENHPNLIMIMNESYSDLRDLGTLETEPEVMSFYDSLTENTIKGTAYSSVYGGYTANSEFEFLTGCSKLFLPGSPYLQYIEEDMPSLIWNLKSQGYEEPVAIHPYRPSGYNRNRVYPLLGFEKFLSLSDFSGEDLVRDYIGDAEDYEKIEELFEKKKPGTSLCVFNVTMQNHNAYDDRAYVFKEPVHVKNFKADFAAEQYLSLMHMSDQALEQLITYFSGVSEPTMILLFGDHQPHLADSFYKEIMGKVPGLFSEEQVMEKHKVPFLIWANFDIPEQTIEGTSINYLSTILLQTAGLRLTPFNRYLSELRKKVPVISASGCYDSEGKLFHYTDEDNETEAGGSGKTGKLLHTYEGIIYNYIFDKKNHLGNYFTISK
ncbi:MAG: LTA synthase family protein [Lachnospiraceae bacterium]|nr:LTA synthase family protein [Lachnospiraceae bacterium]